MERMKNSSFIDKVYEEESCNGDVDDCPVCLCGCRNRIQVGSQIAADIREGLKHELGITCCAGISHNKLLAKLVGSIHKPNQQTSILPHLGCQLVSSLPGVRSIPGIGHTSEKRLKARGISSVWELQQAPKSLLEEEFGPATSELFSKLCFGIDDSPVVTFTLPQTLSDEDSFKCCNNFEDAKSRIHQLGVSLLKRLKDDTRTPHTLRLTVRKNNYVRFSRQCPIPASLFAELREPDGIDKTLIRLIPILINLFHKLIDTSQTFHLTLINICFAKLVEPNSKQNTIDTFFTGRSHASVRPNLAHCDSAEMSTNNVSCKVGKSFQSSNDPCVAGHVNLIGNQFMLKKDFKNVCNIDIAHSTGHIENEGGKPRECDLSPSDSKANQSNSSCIVNDDKSFLYMKMCDSDNTVNKDPKRIYDKDNVRFISPSKVQSLKELQRLLPKHFDANEVLQLPNDIQSEILSSFGIRCTNTHDGERTYSAINRISTRSQFGCERFSENQHEELQPTHVSSHHRRPLFSPRNKKVENEVPKNNISNSAVIKSVERPENHSKNIRKSEKFDNVKSSYDDECQIRKPDRESLTLIKGDSFKPNDVKQEKCELSDGNENSLDVSSYESTSKSCKMTEDLGVESIGGNSTKAHDNDNDNQMMNLANSISESTFTKNATEIIQFSDKNEDMSVQSKGQQVIDQCTGQLKSKKRKCPQGFDEDVFFSLPSHIQGEILAHSAMGTGNLFLDHQNKTQTCQSVNLNERSHKSVQNGLLKYFKKS